MITSIFIIVIAYFFFSLAFLGDKLVLNGPPNPKLYTFYVGALNVLVIFLLPFVVLSSLNTTTILLAFLIAITSLVALYTMFTALEKFEASRVMPTIGALQPVVILLLTGLFWGFEAINGINFLAFIMLIIGSLAISVEKKFTITIKYLLLTVGSSLMFSLAYIFSKMIFLNTPFLMGIMLIGLCNSVLVLVLLFDKTLRVQVFSKKPAMDKKTRIVFLSAQGAGGVANILQSLAIALAPVSHLATMNALRGIQYVFLFIIMLFFSNFYPTILKEDISKKIIIQKTIAIVIIVLGLAMLVLN